MAFISFSVCVDAQIKLGLIFVSAHRSHIPRGQALCPDGVQNTLPQNMATWHTEDIKLKEFEKQPVQEGHSDFSLLPQSSS